MRFERARKLSLNRLWDDRSDGCSSSGGHVSLPLNEDSAKCLLKLNCSL